MVAHLTADHRIPMASIAQQPTIPAIADDVGCSLAVLVTFIGAQVALGATPVVHRPPAHRPLSEAIGVDGEMRLPRSLGATQLTRDERRAKLRS